MENELLRGAIINHRKYGKGIIQEIDDRYVVVAFEHDVKHNRRFMNSLETFVKYLEVVNPEIKASVYEEIYFNNLITDEVEGIPNDDEYEGSIHYFRSKKNIKYNDTFYIGKYFSKKFIDENTLLRDEHIFRQSILDYKNGVPHAVEWGTKLIADAINTLLVNQNLGEKIILVSAPCSKMDKKPITSTSIEKIIRYKLVDGIEVIDGSKYLVRVRDVATSHTSASNERPSIQTHLDSIEFRGEKVVSNATYIVIDDICTRGCTLKACEKILEEAGINHTINLVIGRTWYMSNENIIKQILLLKFMKGIGPVKINTDYVPLIKKGLTLDELRTKLSDNGADKDEIENAYAGMLEAYSKIESRDDIKVITVCDEKYPRKLMDMGNKRPTVLLVKGDASLLYDDAIAVIGTRKPSEWSVQVEQRIVKRINEISDKVIVSGLADGCDYIAHTVCIKNGGRTLACLPCGFDTISPVSHKELSEIILKNGGTLITEYWPEEEATRYTFVERDNIIAALSDSTLVIECEKTSGTMHTVRAAEKYKRLLGAFITKKNKSGNYEGNEYMIKDLRAEVIENTVDLEAFVNKSHCGTKKDIKQLSFADFGY